MSKIDTYLGFQEQYGGSLESIQKAVERREEPIISDYINFLEEKYEDNTASTGCSCGV